MKEQVSSCCEESVWHCDYPDRSSKVFCNCCKRECSVKERVSVEHTNWNCPKCGIDKEQFMKLLAIAAEYEKCIDVKKYCTIPVSTYNAIVEERDRLKQLEEFWALHQARYEKLSTLDENIAKLILSLKNGLPNLIDKSNEEMLKQIIELLESLSR